VVGVAVRKRSGLKSTVKRNAESREKMSSEYGEYEGASCPDCKIGNINGFGFCDDRGCDFEEFMEQTDNLWEGL